MVKVQKISSIEPTIGFTEFDIIEKYRKSFQSSELGHIHSLFPFEQTAGYINLKASFLGRKSYFTA